MNKIFNDLIIFEMANSHQGSVEHGKNIIREMGKITRKYNVKTAVKLQYRNLDTFIHPDFKNRKDVNHIERFMETRLTYEQFTELVATVKNEGMVTMATPFDEDGVDWCMDQGLDVIKVASCSATDWPLLEKIALTKKPVIISTGGKTIIDVDNIYNFLIHRGCYFAFMHCVAEYPAPIDHIQLDFIDKLKRRYGDVIVGYSGHEDPDDNIVPVMAVAKGASILERHVGLPTDTISLNAYSMNPDQTDAWVRSIVSARTICALQKDSDKFISQDEIDSLRSLMRGVFAANPIKSGDRIRLKDVFFAMPCLEQQMTSSEFSEGIVASRDYKPLEPIQESRPVTNIRLIRSVIHDAKGLLLEAGIALGDSFEVELSHHYGVEHFRNTGALIISIINREYCKKLIVVLGGQKHPFHYHKIKEETFQLLYGDLTVNVGDTVRYMKAGDIQTVMRNERHAFSSVNGAVFEEISTTHIKGDSYYEDPAINKKDIVERKTIIKDW